MKKVRILPLALAAAVLASLLLAGCGVSQADYDEVFAQKTALEAEKQTLQGQYDDLELQLLAANDQVAALEAVYPPRDFASLRELEDWLAANDVSEKPETSNAEDWIGRALEVQEDALADGYVVSVDYDGPDADGLYLVYCTTVINGYIYFWDPETDEVWQDTNLGAVK